MEFLARDPCGDGRGARLDHSSMRRYHQQGGVRSLAHLDSIVLARGLVTCELGEGAVLASGSRIRHLLEPLRAAATILPNRGFDMPKRRVPETRVSRDNRGAWETPVRRAPSVL